MRILFIEDNKTKAESVKAHLEAFKHVDSLTLKESFTSGLRELFTNEYDALLLDMSLPTREGKLSKAVNNFEQLGGYKIMSEMKRKNKIIPTILITMFSEFGVGKTFMNLEELDSMLQNNFKDSYKAYIYYSSQDDNWKNKLTLQLESLV